MQSQYLDALQLHSMLLFGAGIGCQNDKLHNVTGLQILHILNLQQAFARVRPLSEIINHEYLQLYRNRVQQRADNLHDLWNCKPHDTSHPAA